MIKYAPNFCSILLVVALVAAVGCQSPRKARSTHDNIYGRAHEMSYDDTIDRPLPTSSGSPNANESFGTPSSAAHCPSCH